MIFKIQKRRQLLLGGQTSRHISQTAISIQTRARLESAELEGTPSEDSRETMFGTQTDGRTEAQPKPPSPEQAL